MLKAKLWAVFVMILRQPLAAHFTNDDNGWDEVVQEISCFQLARLVFTNMRADVKREIGTYNKDHIQRLVELGSPLSHHEANRKGIVLAFKTFMEKFGNWMSFMYSRSTTMICFGLKGLGMFSRRELGNDFWKELSQCHPQGSDRVRRGSVHRMISSESARLCLITRLFMVMFWYMLSFLCLVVMLLILWIWSWVWIFRVLWDGPWNLLVSHISWRCWCHRVQGNIVRIKK